MTIGRPWKVNGKPLQDFWSVYLAIDLDNSCHHGARLEGFLGKKFETAQAVRITPNPTKKA